VSKTQTVEQSLADFNYGGTPDDLLIFKASTNRIFSQDYAADASDLSAKYYDSNEQFNGAEHIFPDGYSQIPAALAKGLNVILNKPIKEIEY
jgi:hypothetical protein